MKIFHFLGKHIAYTFSLALLTVIHGAVLLAAGIVFACPHTVLPYNEILEYISRGFLPVFLCVIFIYFVWYGFFTPVKIPAIKRGFRELNRAFRNTHVLTVTALENAYNSISSLPLNNMVSSFFIVFVSGTACIGLVLYQFKIEKTIDIVLVRQLVKFIGMSTVFSSLFYGFYAFLYSDYITSSTRAEFYNLLGTHGARMKPRAYFSIKVKYRLVQFIVLVVLGSIIGFVLKLSHEQPDTWIMVISFLAVSYLVIFLFIRMSGKSVSFVLGDMAGYTDDLINSHYEEEVFCRSMSLDREISVISHNLIKMSKEMREHRTNLEREVGYQKNELEHALSELQVKDNQIQKQLDMATLFQRSIMPEDIHDWNELKFSTRYIAMDSIGGDFFDMKTIKDDKIGVMIADVSGHGIQAALVTALAKISFDNAMRISDSPQKIFQEVNKNILEHIKTKEYMTCFLAIIDDEYKVVYSNASHQKAFFVQKENNRVELLDTNGLFIGASEDARGSYEENSLQMNYGDRIVLYSDGIPQALNDKKEEFSVKRLESLIRNNAELSLDQFADLIINEVKKHIGDDQYKDDLTVIVIELAYDEAVKLVRDAKKLINTHKYNEAIMVLQNGLRNFSGNRKLLYNLAKSYFRIDDYNKAIETIKAYLQDDRKNKYAYYLGGASYYKLGEYKSAAAYYRDALNIDPGFTYALFALGMSYKKAGNNEEAVKVFQRVSDIDPNNKMALYEIEELNK